ncbi:MAG: hypothetical protein ACRD0J_15480, partial [Acidimicrobiales bacterium]
SAPAASGAAAVGDHACTGSGAGGGHRATLVVQPSAGTVVQRCVPFTGSTVKALALLRASHVEMATQSYPSLGAALCQVDHVPAHYASCLPKGKPYWALFVSKGGQAWSSPPKGISSVSVGPGDAVGLRYDSPTGTPTPPSVPPPHP